jgi:hypothetical protein
MRELIEMGIIGSKAIPHFAQHVELPPYTLQFPKHTRERHLFPQYFEL